MDVFIQKTSRKHNLGYDISFEEALKSSINDPIAADLVRTACANENLPVTELKKAWRASEDFGQYANISKSAMFLIGSGENQPQLHNPDFDFPDALIETGHNIFNRLIKNICQ